MMFKDGHRVPVLDWLDRLQRKARLKCYHAFSRLESEGHKLRRPEADNLGDGIYELRVKHSGNNYRILYSFDGQTVVVLTHAFSKKTGGVPKRDIATAIKRMAKYRRGKARYSFTG
ncbi:MAG: type II toxin-antitoxin system RelE/ParE family toxin [candidate division Zixibacteria bacterium]|nr:type II toxin-antitoxin system RelE/ParE family toxin [candidate division Zixibacteria bacterium]